MPIYEYICPECKSRFELLQPISQAGNKVPCPHCHKPAEPVLSLFACLSQDEGRLSSSIGGSSCSSCSASSCDSCGL